MKKRITAIIVALAVTLSCAFIIPSTMHNNDCFAKSKTKYVKIKKTTYEKMKKTIASQKTTIANQKKTITARNNTINSYKTTVANQKTTIAEQKLEISEKEQTIKDKKQTIGWLWSTLEDFGYFYNYDSHKWEQNIETAEPEGEPIEIGQVALTEDASQVELIAEETGLVIDTVQLIESYKDKWFAYYVYANGDIYTITVNNGHVEVCTQLN